MAAIARPSAIIKHHVSRSLNKKKHLVIFKVYRFINDLIFLVLGKYKKTRQLDSLSHTEE